MWKDILKIEGDMAGFFRDFEKNKIKELAQPIDGKENINGWNEIGRIADEYGLPTYVGNLIYFSNSGVHTQLKEPIVDIASYNKAVRARIEEGQKRDLQRKKDSYKPKRKGQRRRR